MLPGIEGDEIIIDCASSTRKLCLIVRLEGNHVKSISPNNHRSWILCGDMQPPCNRAVRHIHNRDLVFRGQRNVSFLIIRKRNANGLIKSRGFGFLIELLNRRNHLHIGRLIRIVINDTHRIGNMVGNPNFFAVRANSNTHGINPHVNTFHDTFCLNIDDIQRIRWGVDHEDKVPMNSNRFRMGTDKGRMTDCSRAST